ncbi:MAG: SirB2 family protein [Zetaproteobacteria bacterium]|nr:SirB2 family protein [Zetaproteobacteria bacterium]
MIAWDYGFMKGVHQLLVAISATLFLGRCWMMWRSNAVLGRTLGSRYLPDAIDTLLLISGITLMVLSAQYPTTYLWMFFKLLLLLLYIVLGAVALHRGKTARVRKWASVAAIGVLGSMIALAMLH